MTTHCLRLWYIHTYLCDNWYVIFGMVWGCHIGTSGRKYGGRPTTKEKSNNSNNSGCEWKRRLLGTVPIRHIIDGPKYIYSSYVTKDCMVIKQHHTFYFYLPIYMMSICIWWSQIKIKVLCKTNGFNEAKRLEAETVLEGLAWKTNKDRLDQSTFLLDLYRNI